MLLDFRARLVAGAVMALASETWMATPAASAADAGAGPAAPAGGVSAAGGPGAAPAAAAGLPIRRELTGPWTFRRALGQSRSVEPWLPARVPGSVHTDLFTNGKIGDPFYRENEKAQQWIEREDWEYRTSFSADPALLGRDRVELVFRGLDTYAEVFLNGTSILSANNMFRSWRADVKPRLRPGENHLYIRFRSPIREVKPAYDRLGYKLPAVNDQATEMVSMWTRKAPYHYGWDWGPRFVTSGVWRPVVLEAWDEARLDAVQVIQGRLDAAVAELRVKVRVVAARAGRVKVTVALPGEDPGTPGASATPLGAADAGVKPGASATLLGAVDAALKPGASANLLGVVDADLKPGASEITVPVRIAKPQLWWPSGLGPQRLYTLEVRLAGAGGVVRDARGTRIGLRTVEVVHARDAAGKSFFIKVNGAPVFMKGANWIPADSFVTRMTDERYRYLIRSAADANMNMLRVWGGGIYEDDRFYEICDELGILVWQDFMFACSMYPGDAEFLENVRQEAVENVRRLRHHPSLALWAGNNEIEAAWQGWGWPQKFKLSRAAQDRIWSDYKKVFHEILPAVVAAEDPGRFYTRSSPSANEDGVPANKRNMGDMHYWGVWHAQQPYTMYADNVSRFMSEYGFQSFPELASVARYTAKETDWDIGSPVMLAHQRHPRGNALISTYLDRDFRRPKDFPSFLYVQQVLQATVIKYAAEAHRRRMGHNWGSLYWQLDDCWPVASWSGIDYYGRWKALHYAARRFFAPVLVSPVEAKGGAKGGDNIEVWAISDRRADARVRLTVRVLDLAGGEIMRREADVTLAANASRAYLTLSRAEALKGAKPEQAVLVAELSERGKSLGRNILTFVTTKEMALPAPEIATEVEPQRDGAFAIKVTSRRFARAVYLTAGPEGFFDDNYFDLLPGESRVVSFRPQGAAPTAEALRATLRVTSIADSY